MRESGDGELIEANPPKDKMVPDKILFSVVVPTYGRAHLLSECLAALAKQDYPKDRWEVLVVDDGSPNPPQEVVQSFRESMDVDLLIKNHAGPAAARNHGAARARGEYIAFTDDDCAPAPDWLSALEARFKTNPRSAIGGKSLNNKPANLYSTASQLLIDYLYAYYNEDPDHAVFLTSNNLAVPTAVFHEVGGFDTGFVKAAAEDRELCDRWIASGYPLIYAPEVIVGHNHELSLRTFCRQHFNYGTGAFRFHQIWIERHHKNVRVEPALFYLKLLGYPFSRSNSRSDVLLALSLLVSQGANATGFLWQRLISKKEPERIKIGGRVLGERSDGIQHRS
jgi:GT2 family glycosyltransferase